MIDNLTTKPELPICTKPPPNDSCCIADNSLFPVETTKRK